MRRLPFAAPLVHRLFSAARNFITAVLGRAGVTSVLTRPNLILALVLVLSATGLAVVTSMAVRSSVDTLLEEDAAQAAEDWANDLIRRLPRLPEIASGAALDKEEVAVVAATRHSKSVFLFKLFDAYGRLRLSADAASTFDEANVSLVQHNPAASRALKSGRTYIDVRIGAGKRDRPDHYAEAYVPIMSANAVVAVVEVYVDQTKKYFEYRRHALEASARIGLIAALAFGIPAIGVFIRSQQVRKASKEIKFLADHDHLTGLPNRVTFKAALDEVWRDARAGTKAAIMCLDLDRFKAVNDSLGHAAGDELLRQVSARLRSIVRRSDVIARLSGDEFALIQSPIDNPSDCEALAERIVREMAEPFCLGDHNVQIGTSVGIALLPDDATCSEGAIKAADIALYRAKADGRGTFRFFSRDMDEALQLRRELEAEMRLAIGTEQFEIHYQPILDMQSDRVVCYEALLRWRHPVRGLISPADFIPLAEETGLIVQIGRWVLKAACRAATGWPSGTRVAVNISAVQFRGGKIVNDVACALRETQLSPSSLELEVTESVILDKTADTLGLLHDLKALGVRIAMDDFGTGYSSLSYLQKFPFDKIKIDKSFIDELGTSGSAVEIVRAVISLGATLGKSTTAEGVESGEQLKLLRQYGCSEVQGYLIGRPNAVIDHTPEELRRTAKAA